MFEVELKVRADHESVRSALADTDADERRILAQEDTYYDAPHRDFGETDEALRVRRAAEVETVDDPPATVIHGAVATEGRGWLTYKGPLVESASKTRKEFETVVEDAEAMETILDRVGFQPAGSVRKLRREYEWRGFHLCLDSVVGLGAFLEVEAGVTEAEIETTRDRAAELLSDLGLDPGDQIRRSYLELLAEEE